MNRLRSLPFSYRVLLGCLIVALVPMLIGNMLAIRTFDSTLQNQAMTAAGAQVVEVEQRLADILAGCDTVTARIASDRTVAQALIDNTYGLQANVSLTLLQAGRTLYPGAVLSLYDVGGALRFSTDNAQSPLSLPTRWGVLRKAGTSPDTVYYSGESLSEPPPVFAIQAARELYTGGGILVGYVVVSLPPELLHSAFGGLYTDTGSLLVLDLYGGLAYSSRPISREGLGAVRDRLLYRDTSVLERGDNLFFWAPGSVAGYSAVLRQPKPFTGGNLQVMQRVQFYTSLMSLVLCALFSFLISRSLASPVSQLSKAMERVKRGDLDIRVDTKRMDQLGRLAADFNLMAEELKLYMEKVVRQQREMDDAQIRLLQAQLNPHFLYNTLDTVKWLAKINSIPEIASIAGNLAIILRQCVSREDFVPLRQELDMIRGYIDIQRIRFSGRFRYVVNAPEDLLDSRIPKLILQPIVENAILHGLGDKEDGYVYIYAMEEGGDLQISVTDNGCGMPPAIVRRLNQPDSEIVDGHLGLYNVLHILRINYGEGYGLSANSIQGTGTTVTVKAPNRKGVAEL